MSFFSPTELVIAFMLTTIPTRNDTNGSNVIVVFERPRAAFAGSPMSWVANWLLLFQTSGMWTNLATPTPHVVLLTSIAPHLFLLEPRARNQDGQLATRKRVQGVEKSKLVVRLRIAFPWRP